MGSEEWVLPVVLYAPYMLYMCLVFDDEGSSSLTYLRSVTVNTCYFLYARVIVFLGSCFPKYVADCFCGFKAIFMFVFLNNFVIVRIYLHVYVNVNHFCLVFMLSRLPLYFV